MSFRTRFTALLLAFFLMLSNVGLALNVHFCGETKVASKLVYSQVVEEACTHDEPLHGEHSQENCSAESSCCGSSDDHFDCCKDEYITQDNLDVIIQKTFFWDVDAFLIADYNISFQLFNYSENLTQEHFEYSYQSNAPPLYKRYCRLVFYA